MSETATPRTDGCARENARFCADTGLAAALALSRQLERESDALRRELEEAKVKAFEDGKAAQAILETRGRDAFIADKRMELNAESNSLRDQLAAAKKKIEELKRDKERLDWISRDPDTEVEFNGQRCDARLTRQAIDSAIAQAKAHV